MNNITIDLMHQDDAKLLHKAFSEQNGTSDTYKTLELYERYYNESRQNKRTILVARCRGEIAGYVTVKPRALQGPFVGRDIPEIKDFNVLIKYRAKGVGTKLMDQAESIAANRSKYVSLAVGMYKDYGVAQKMYVKRGYVPDGTGLWYRNEQVVPGQQYTVDDDLILYFIKKIR